MMASARQTQSTKNTTHNLRTKNVHKCFMPFKITLLAASIALTPSVNARGANSSMNQFFDGLGYNTNVTNPNTYKGQTADYYNGGNLFVRTKITESSITQFTMPSISAGCGGIDAFLGGFSHINADEIVQFGKSIIANATPFAVNLALQTWAPEIAAIKKDLEDISDKWLNQSINSCETAQAAVGGLAVFAEGETKKHICATMGTQDNAFADWVSARQKCGAGGQSEAELEKARQDPALENLTKTSHNVMWDALLKEPILSNDKELAEFFMGLTGTLVYDKKGTPVYYPSLLIRNKNMIDVLLNGGTTQRYECDDKDIKRCLNITKTNEKINVESGLQVRIVKMLDALHDKVMSDTALSVSEKSFVSYSHVPALKFILNRAERNLELDTISYGKLIATELVARYLNESLNMVRTSISNTSIAPDDLEVMLRAVENASGYASGLYKDAQASIAADGKLINDAREQKKVTDNDTSKDINKNLREK
jgi:conjugative transfer pilus assembly protein TraH